MMMICRFIAAFCVAIFFCTGVHAEPQQDPLIVLVQAEGTWKEPFVRVHAELRSLGFRVKPLTVSEQDLSKIETIAKKQGAVAAIVIRAEKQFVDIWVHDLLAKKTIRKHFTLGELVGPDAHATVGLQTAELVQASQLKLRIKSSAPPTTSKDTDRPWSIGLGWSAFATAGEFSSAMGPSVFGQVNLTKHIFSQLHVSWLPFGGRHRDERGNVQTRLWVPRMFVGIRPWAGKTLTPSFSLGGGVLWGQARGSAADGFTFDAQTGRSAMLSGRVELPWRASRSVRISAALEAGVVPSPIKVTFDDEVVQSIGRSSLMLTLGLEWI